MKSKYIKLDDVIKMLDADLKNTNDSKAQLTGDNISATCGRAACDILAKHTAVLTMAILERLKIYEFDDDKNEREKI